MQLGVAFELETLKFIVRQILTNEKVAIRLHGLVDCSQSVCCDGTCANYPIRAIRRQISHLLLESTTQSPLDGTCAVMKNTPTLSIYEEEHKYSICLIINLRL